MNLLLLFLNWASLTVVVAAVALVVAAAVAISTNAPGFLTIYKNGVEAKRGLYGIPAAAINTYAVSGVVSLNGSTDYVEIFVFQDSGGAVTPQGGAALTWFDGTFLRGL